jgi:hypothetical protein
VTRKPLALLPAALLAGAVLLTGCAGHDGSAGPGSGAPTGSASPPAGPSDLAHMRKLVDDADSAAAVADSDAAADN